MWNKNIKKLSRGLRMRTAGLAALAVMGAVLLFYYVVQYPLLSRGATRTLTQNVTITDSVGRWGTNNNYNFSSDDVIVNAGVTLTLLGENHFRSLTVNGTVTTQAITSADIDTSLTPLEDGYLRASGLAKKVHIVTSGGVNIGNSGVINVSAKGFSGGKHYPGDGSGVTAPERGYGPGGYDYADYLADTDITTHDYGFSTIYTPGASFGGFGGKGTRVTGDETNAIDSAAVYSDSGLGTLMPGSGAAFAYSSTEDFSGATGGNGGGLVVIEAANFGIAQNGRIVANGEDGGCNAGLSCQGGGGSGGAIFIQVTGEAVFPYYPSAAAGAVDIDEEEDSSVEAGSVLLSGVAPTLTASAENSNITANGGGGLCLGGGNGGGGGRVVLFRTTSDEKVTKQLMPVSRNGVPDIFNPYALQDNDIILVILTIYQTGGSQITVTDDLLKYTSESGDRICRPIGGTFSINPADAGADPLVWVMEPTGESAIISYQCKVER